MRVRPISSTGTMRYARRNMRLGGHLVPEGTLITVPYDAVHHHPDNWADPDAFIPVWLVGTSGTAARIPCNAAIAILVSGINPGIQLVSADLAETEAASSAGMHLMAAGPARMLQERWAEKGAELVAAPSSPKKPDLAPGASEATGGARRYLPFGTGPRQCGAVASTS